MQEENRQIKISIIIPCYNTEKYVAEALESVLNQNFPDMEVICMNDGSTDRTLEILKEYQDNYSFISVYSDENHGQGYQRNAGIRLARGTYIYFMDSDDKLREGCLLRLYEYAQEHALDVLYFEGDSFYETEELEEQFPQYQTLYHRKKDYSEVSSGELLLQKTEPSDCFIASPCLQFTRLEHLRRNEILFPVISALEDNVYTLTSMLAAERVSCIPDSLYLRRVRRESTMTVKAGQERLKAYYCVVLEFLRILYRYQGQPETERAIYSRIGRFGRNITKLFDSLTEEQKVDILKHENMGHDVCVCLMQHLNEVGERIRKEENSTYRNKVKSQTAQLCQITKDIEHLTKKTHALDDELKKEKKMREELNETLRRSEQAKQIAEKKLHTIEEDYRQLQKKQSRLEQNYEKSQKELQKTKMELTGLKRHFLVRVDLKLRRIKHRITCVIKEILHKKER